MWSEKALKIIPIALFLFCVLEIFELVLIINNMNKTEKLENDSRNNLEIVETIADLLNKYSQCKLEHFEDKNVKIK
ncbi:hypothetical protein F7205_00385 [Helicobacter pylori]|uniref:hypothetical protein n=1 Tax=Helicobacter pylori TaxID=210 RepID=UPI0012E8D86F|nr:hypothetical protein [Helicobacter pylori]MUU51984.1 hypothetical protein [Helicobacter pylori]